MRFRIVTSDQILQLDDLTVLGNMLQNAVWNTYLELGTTAYTQGDHSMGDTMLDAALQEAQRITCSNADPGPVFHKLAHMYYKQNKLEKAESVYQQALELFDRMFKPDEQNLSLILLNLAELYFSQHKYQQALPLYERSVLLAERLHGANNPVLERRLLKLSWIYCFVSDFENADKIYSRVMRIREAQQRATVAALDSRFVTAW